jgi:uncharacterized protein (UPF0332 family)
MSEFEPSAQVVQDLETHATERLRAARELLKLGLYADSVTRAYYAAFSAVTLLHYLAGNSYSSHRQVLGQFNKQYIHSGIFEKRIGVELQDLLLKRQKADYDASARFSDDGARDTLRSAEWICQEILTYCRKSYPSFFRTQP